MLDPSHLDLNQPFIFALWLELHPAPLEPSLQCAQCQIMLLTEFAPPKSTGFEFPHQSLNFLAASPLPDANLYNFRHPDTASKNAASARCVALTDTLEQIKSQIQKARSDALPKSVLAKACNYTLTLWTRLSRFLEHPELELSNNLAENAMRPLALGRRNWIHIGSEQAGPRVAAIISLVETCRRLKIPIRDYLASVLPGLANFPINRIAELTPAAWLARN